MGRVENTPKVDSLDAYSKDEWVDFLKQGAYRGLKINKVARHIGKSKSCTYDKATHRLDLINGKGKTITLDMAKLLEKNERWTLSRLVHNIKMCVSTDYALNFDIRIRQLAEAITKKTGSDFSSELEKFVDDDHDLDEIKTIFNRNLGVINQSTGNKEIQDNLLKLSAQAFEQADDAKSRLLAFQIQCTANAMVPDPNLVWEVLPHDIHNLLFSKVCKNEGIVNHPLNIVSKQLNDNASNVNENWIDEDAICLKTEGCKSAKEAVQYIIDHQLTSANLSNFHDLVAEDLEELSKNCPQLIKLSLRPIIFSGTKLLEALGKFTDLKCLNIQGCTQTTGDNLVEIAKMHPGLQHLDVGKCDRITGEKLMEAIKLLPDLKGLGLSGFWNGLNSPVNADQLIQIAKMRPNLTILDINSWGGRISGDQMEEIAKRLPNLKHLNIIGNCYCNDSDHIFKIAKTLSNLQGFDFEFYGATETLIELFKSLPNLRKLDLRYLNFTPDQLIDTVKLLPDLRELKISWIDQISDVELAELATFLPNLLDLNVICPYYINARLDAAFKHHPKLKIKLT